MLISSSFLLNEEVELARNMRKLLEPSIDSFSDEQVSSAVSLLNHIANFDSPANPLQIDIIDAFKDCFRSRLRVANEWA